MKNNSLCEIRVNVEVGGDLKTIFSVSERPSGDVFIRLMSGLQVGLPPHERVIQENRFSVHVSERSVSFNTIKKTLKFKDEDAPQVSSMLTDAIKAKTGFAHIFSHRCTDLDSSIYNRSPTDKKNRLLGVYDPKMTSLVCGILVGPVDIYFPEEYEGVLVRKILTSRFQFIILSTTYNIPALPFAWTRIPFTFNPQIWGVTGIDNFFGLSPNECIELFRNDGNALARNLLELHLQYVSTEENKQFIKELMATLPAGSPELNIQGLLES